MSDTKKPQDEKKEKKPAEEKKQEAAASTDDSSSDDKKPALTDDLSQGGEVEVPAKFKSIVEEIEKMSVLDLSELVKILEDKFGVSAAAPMMMGAMPGAVTGADPGAIEEKSEFDVELTGVGDNKINVIKTVREITDKGLKEAKDMVEAVPVMLKEGAKKEEAENIKKKLEEAGATVTLK